VPNYLNIIAVDLVDLYRERLGKFLDIVGVSLSVGISFWVAHDAFGYFFQWLI